MGRSGGALSLWARFTEPATPPGSVLIAIGLGSLFAATGAVVLAFQNPDVSEPGVAATLLDWMTLSYVVAGLVAWFRRPLSRFGPLMIAAGFANSLTALSWSTSAVPYTVGQALDLLAPALFLHVFLAYPSGRVTAGFDRAVVGCGYAVAIGLELARMLLGGGGDLNLLEVAHDPGAAESLRQLQFALLAAVASCGLGILAVRWRSASPALRRVLAPVVLPGAFALVMVAAFFVSLAVSGAHVELLRRLTFVSMGVAPIAYLVGLLRGEFALRQLVLALSRASRPDDLRNALRNALHDPSLKIAYWVRERREFVDFAGRPMELPTGTSDQAVTLVEHDQQHVGALIHDPSLQDQPELFEAASAVGAITVKGEWLDRELQSRIAELERERDFVATLVDSTPALFCVLDENGNIVRYNMPLARLTGRPDHAVCGLPFADALVAQLDTNDFHRHVTGPDGVEHETALRRHDGSEAIVAWSRCSIVDGQGRQRVLFSGMDITERRREREELRESRSRLVHASDAARRRIERDLHDGAQQRLLGLSMTLRLLESRLGDDPSALALMHDSKEQLRQSLEQLREVAHGIHPAVLSDHGLSVALPTVAARAPLPVELDVTEDRLPPRVEVAAYYLVCEALTNVAKHARASRARVSAIRSGDWAIVEVEDDGVGGADLDGGSGLRGLVDRVDALAGKLTIHSEGESGTRITAELPCS